MNDYWESDEITNKERLGELIAENAVLRADAEAFRWLAAQKSRVDILRSADQVAIYVWLDMPVKENGQHVFWRTYVAPTLPAAVALAMDAERAKESAR